MAEQGKTYVCSICGQEVRVTKAGIGTLVCCNKPMKKKEESKINP
ncbi:MAG: desulfoferrodoxin FeS4 iron-binding domain-containing protein [Candidatus Aminicenantales bacterium]